MKNFICSMSNKPLSQKSSILLLIIYSFHYSKIFSQVKELEEKGEWTTAPILNELKKKAKALGLWNLFLPGLNNFK